MEDQRQHTVNGQSVLQADLNAMGETAALADDRVLAELFRMAPYDGAAVRKGVLPPAHAESAATFALVAPNGATGRVLVNPFRAVVGTRTEIDSNAKLALRDIRSAIAVGTTTLGQTASLAANDSGNPRWDLVWAAVSVDQNAISVTRKVKDPSTKVIAGQSVVTTVATVVALGITTGVPSGISPVWPDVPSDVGGVYYIPLAYIGVPDGFDDTSTVDPSWIACAAPVLTLSRAMGGQSCGPANQAHVLSEAQQTAWADVGRPSRFLPPDMTGMETLIVALDLSDATEGNHSHANGDVIDSRDWRNRLCWWWADIVHAGVRMPWEKAEDLALTAETIMLDSTAARQTTAADVDAGYDADKRIRPAGNGQTIIQNYNSVIAQASLVTYLDADGIAGAAIAGLADHSIVHIYCDHADGGKLKVGIGATNPRARITLRLDFSAPYSNVR